MDDKGDATTAKSVLGCGLWIWGLIGVIVVVGAVVNALPIALLVALGALMTWIAFRKSSLLGWAIVVCAVLGAIRGLTD